MRILLVDDDNNKVVEVSRVIRETGIDIRSLEVVTTAADAMRKLECETIDLLIVDLVLPKRLGESPVSDGGASLVQNVHRSTRVNTPEFIIGLTADEDALRSSQETFSSLLWSIELTGHDRAEWKLRLQQKIQHLRAREDQRNKGDTQPGECDVLFVCALLNPEISQLHIASGVDWTRVSYENDPTLYWKSEISFGDVSRPVHSTCLPQMGLVAAATGVSQAVRTLRPKMVVMTGICAGRKGDCDLGDIISANITWDYGSGKFVKCDDKVTFQPSPVHVLADASVHSATRGLLSDGMLLSKFYSDCPGFRPPSVPRLRIGPMASGAAVQNYPEFFSEVADQNRKILGVDMEAFGVAWACHQSIEPHPRWLIAKGVSDFADGNKHDGYQEFASFMSAKIAIEVVSNVI